MKTKNLKNITTDKIPDKQNSPGFNMPLPMNVSGIDAQGKEFQEPSVLTYISSEEASFFLKTRVARQSLLRLVIPLPPKLSAGQPLNLVVKGKILSVESVLGDENAKKILLKLDSRYFIGADKT
jgi:hypothetical protein